MAVPVASPYNRPGADAGLGKPRPLIPVPPKRGVEFRFQKLLDEAANAAPHPGFQGIEPIVRKEKRPFVSIRWRLYSRGDNRLRPLPHTIQHCARLFPDTTFAIIKSTFSR
jgi:hypothetical protein